MTIWCNFRIISKVRRQNYYLTVGPEKASPWRWTVGLSSEAWIWSYRHHSEYRHSVLIILVSLATQKGLKFLISKWVHLTGLQNMKGGISGDKLHEKRVASPWRGLYAMSIRRQWMAFSKSKTGSWSDFIKIILVGRVEDGLQRANPKARREAHQLWKLRKENKV